MGTTTAVGESIMHLVELTCRGFRGLEAIRFRPGPGLNIIHGDNAQGKTSLLEAILFGATSKSHRTSLESELVRRDADAFHLALHARRRDRDVRLEASWRSGVKRFKVNGVPQTRISDILGKINVVFFCPEDVSLVSGAASYRRRFLDMELSQLLPDYLAALQHYRQALRQRNELLRQSACDNAQLDVWDDQLAAHGRVLVEERGNFVAQLGRLAALAHGRIANGEELRIVYKANVPTDQPLLDVLARTRETDRRQGATTRGPHRDDLELSVAQAAARGFASQGQQKTAALAVKLAETELVTSRAGECPILMLDEALAELDHARSRQLLDAIDKKIQCIMTTTDPGDPCCLDGPGFSHFGIVRGCLEER
ncbi:MAG TPA: DNA replication/repair protein RecF [Candidatus Hydrogenedentes bacterium]|nr:DNA replication/repair protein RecF [Candidatus Hydrogenedentota bacterium]